MPHNQNRASCCPHRCEPQPCPTRCTTPRARRVPAWLVTILTATGARALWELIKQAAEHLLS